MITCTENCKYQENGICTYEEVKTSFENLSVVSNCVYFEQE